MFDLFIFSIWAIAFGILSYFSFIVFSVSIQDNTFYVLESLLAVIITFTCWLNIKKKNKKGNLLYGEILGFKHFIEVVEKHRLELLLAENPNYISEIIPYAYVLGVLDKIMPIIEEIFEKPSIEWYQGDIKADTFKKFTQVIIKLSQPSIENGGEEPSRGSRRGYSGGGRSGGGFGGGGGGSW